MTDSYGNISQLSTMQKQSQTNPIYIAFIRVNSWLIVSACSAVSAVKLAVVFSNNQTGVMSANENCRKEASLCFEAGKRASPVFY
ncbi:MAG: hypothetical protein PHQ35_01280 [Phycisphaerae bacterium]|nr:hypothetical protein [Phycisphaerae bacterium]